MNHLALLGDSIFDNAPYVDQGESVIEQVSKLLSHGDRATLLAVDGDVTADVERQLSGLPEDISHVFLSCGGNDALNSASVLSEDVATVGEALTRLTRIRELFRCDYRAILGRLGKLSDNVTVCTVYNSVPDASASELAALALFNEVILEEAVLAGVSLIDLRVICDDRSDYSSVSPIEPSYSGSRKIATAIGRVVYAPKTGAGDCTIYV